jgi:short chain dehydrogenase
LQILVNNAGISSYGETLDMPLIDIQRMLQINAMSVTTLTHQFGNDMKKRGRGRILVVSSICGAVSGIASVAVYSATKAFENSLAAAIGKELEPHGVGVTCLLPGAVRDTEFRSRSRSQEALCWKLPFYTKTPQAVAECGIRALLRGDTEVTPGILNRVFVKVLKPILPQRLHNLLAEIMWNPIQLPFYSRMEGQRHSVDELVQPKLESNSPYPSTSIDILKPIVIRPQLVDLNLPQPRVLILEEPLEEQTRSIEINPDVSFDESANSESFDTDGLSNKITTGDADEKADKLPERKDTEKQNQSKLINPINTKRPNDLRYNEMADKTTPSSELDSLLNQYKRHRSLSIDDP